MAGPPRFSAALSGLLRTCLRLAFGLAWPPQSAVCARVSPVSPACSLRPDPSGLSACNPRPGLPDPAVGYFASGGLAPANLCQILGRQFRVVRLLFGAMPR